MIDATHDPKRLSWIESANGRSDFPIQNLPLGSFDFGAGPRAGIAIGDAILDLKAVAEAGLLRAEARSAVEATIPSGRLNGLLALGPTARISLRHQISNLLDAANPERKQVEPVLRDCLLQNSECQILLPASIGDYTDFYAGINHARNVGRLFRPENPLLPNYMHVPIAYHGRASTVRPSREAVRRPNGQTRRSPESPPTFGPTRALDFELELGIWIGTGNGLGEPIAIEEASQLIAGYCLLNDWSARDIQAWEYQPLGPFLAKSFHTTISPWIVTPEAVAPFRTAAMPRSPCEPEPLPYLRDANDIAKGGLNIRLQVELSTEKSRSRGSAPTLICSGTTRDLYWTVAQMITHHTSNGCALRPGDLLGSGTISGSEPWSYGSLIELTDGGRHPMKLPAGEVRTYLEDDDEITITAIAERTGYRSIGFGACTARILSGHDAIFKAAELEI